MKTITFLTTVGLMLAVTIGNDGIPDFSFWNEELENPTTRPATGLGVHRQNKFFIDQSGNGKWDGVGGGDKVYTAGARGDTLVVGDWNGDGTDDLGAYRP